MPPKTINLNFMFRRTPEQAVNYLRSRQYKVSRGWREVLGEAHAHVFTVANVAKIDLLKDIKTALDGALTDGKTFQQFKKELEPKLQKGGWKGAEKINKKTGEVIPQKFPPHRLKTIYRTNLLSAYAAGREASIEKNKKRRPFAQFIALHDSRTRESHAELDGSIFPVDDPFWNTFTPPLDYNCRCNKRTLTQQQITSREWEVSSSKGKLVRSKVEIGTVNNPKSVNLTGYRLPTGKVVLPHASFGFNPGKRSWLPNLNNFTPRIARDFTQDMLSGDQFKIWVNKKSEEFFPVGVVPAEVSKALKTNGHTVLLSQETLVGHLDKHSNIKIANYADTQKIIDNSQAIVATKGVESHFIQEYQPKKFLRAIVKSVEGTDEIFLTTIHRIRTSQVKELLAQEKLQKKGNP